MFSFSLILHIQLLSGDYYVAFLAYYTIRLI